MTCDLGHVILSHTLYSCVVSPERKEKEKKGNINNNLAVLPSHNKFQNHIRWDDRSLQKIVKDAILNCICDKLRFSHKDISTFEGLKRAVIRIDNDVWKWH